MFIFKSMRFLTCAFFLSMAFFTMKSYNIVYLIANPRSGLVEVLRMSGERKDHKVMHIPANWAYCHAHKDQGFTDIAKGWYREDAPTTYEAAKNDIYKEAEKANVFVGENTHTAKEFLEINKDFVSDPRVHFIFLVSDPHTAIINYYEKKADYFDQLPVHQMTDSLGLKGLYEFREGLIKNGYKAPLVVKSEALYFNTKPTVQQICDYLKIPFIESSLQWKDLSADFKNFSDYGWYTIELTDCAKHWHMDAIKNTRFSKPLTYETEGGKPTFKEIKNEKHQQICMQAYEENKKYYDLLVKAS